MQNFQFKNLHEFCASKQFQKLDENTLCIMDIDGVLFDGLTDPHFWFSNIKKEYLDELKKIVETKTALWIFTDRNLFGFWGPYKKQLMDTLSENGTINVRRYKSSKDFLKKAQDLKKALIINAQKPGEESKAVVGKGLANFSSVIYIAAQDIPRVYDDKELVEKIKGGKIGLYFIDIRK